MKKLQLIRQSEMSDCGHACVAMISNYWGHSLRLPDLRRLLPTTTMGSSLLDISKLFSQLGFRTRALKVPLDEIHLIKLPAIIHWNLNHFVVLKKVKKNRITIYDPNFGIQTYTLEDFSRSFTGIVLEVEKIECFSAVTSTQKLSFYDLLKSTQGVSKFLLFLLILSLGIELLNLINPLFIQYVTDHVIATNNSNNLFSLGLGFLLVICVQTFYEYIRQHMLIYLNFNLSEQFASNIVQHLLQLPLDYFYKRYHGDIQSRFQSIDIIQKKISTDFIRTVLDGLMIFINFVVMMVYSPILTLVVSLFLIFFIIIRFLSYHLLKNQTETSIQQHAHAASIFLETLQSIVPIKVFLKESFQFNNWRNTYINSLNADVKIAKMHMWYNCLQQFLQSFELLLLIIFGTWLILSHRFTAGMLMAFLSYRSSVTLKSASFIQSIFDYKLAGIQLQRIEDIVFHPSDSKENLKVIPEIEGALKIEHLAFQYHPSDPFLFQNLNLHIYAGEKVVIVGPSGSGKSTLLKIMMGLVLPTKGSMYIDQYKIQDLGLKNYRNITAAVMQDDNLLSGSIADNIAFFDENKDLAEIYKAAELACIHDTIHKFPMGYETLIGSGGTTLSGGQKQRILLARALYKKPKILFLDEASSHLDIETEKEINDNLKKLNVTQIIIAHRLETIQMADRVINLATFISNSI